MAVQGKLSELEKELRQIEGILAVGFSAESEAIRIQLTLAPSAPRERVLAEAYSCLAGQTDVVAEIEALGGSSTEDFEGAEEEAVPVSLAELRITPEEVSVTVTIGGASAVGTAPRNAPDAPVAAVLNAVRSGAGQLNLAVDKLSIASEVSHAATVALGAGGADAVGVARASSPEEAAVIATIHAVNRLLAAGR
jgi:hypothetical protein